jgi:hypothetical protein
MNEVREAIGGALYGISAYDLEQVCDALEMPPQPEGGADPFASKRSYINRRLIGCCWKTSSRSSERLPTSTATRV